MIIGNPITLGGGGGGGGKLIDKSITANGTFYPIDDNADGYAKVVVNVPMDREPALAQILARTNGVYNAPSGYDGIEKVTVNVPQTGYHIGKTVSENGVYAASDDGADGFSSVSVNVTPEVIDLNNQPTTKELPAEYQEVEYLTLSGTQYTSIPFATRLGDAFYIAAMPTVNVTDEQTVIGNNASGQRWEMYFKSGKTMLYFGDTSAYNGVALSGVNVAAEINTKYEFAALVTLKTANITAFVIGNYGTGGSYKFKGRIYKIRVTRTVEGAPIYAAYLVPCYRKADNVAGWYDLVAEAFYTNGGTGAYEVGPDITTGASVIPNAPIATMPLSVSSNGTYNVPATIHGYSKVTVNVPNVDNRSYGMDLEDAVYFEEHFSDDAPTVTTGTYTSGSVKIYAA